MAAEGGSGARVCRPLDQQHAAWTALLTRYVREGVVDYAGLARSGRSELGRYLRALEAVCSRDYTAYTREQKLAFWINAYNAYTLKLILEHYPLKSIRSIGFLPGAAFRESFIPLRGMRDDALSLDDIEHEILRKEFREPRIHFAINCASKSCPALRSEAYRAASLDAQLSDAARRFIADPTKNRFDVATRMLYLSLIFDWFKEDFGPAKTLPAFVRRYAAPSMAAALGSGPVRVEFLDYDWSLNGK